MPTFAFLVFEISTYVLAIICFVHAWRHGRYLAITLLVAVVFSYLTEIFAINLVHEYYYNRFLIMICRDVTVPWGATIGCYAHSSCVPLAIPIMEAMLIYATVQTSRRLELPWLTRPILNGLLAMSIDLLMDPIVSASVNCQPSPVIMPPAPVEPGIGFWVWRLLPEHTVLGVTLPEHLFFGVPLNNFTGWFIGIVIFTLMLEIGWRKLPPESKGWWGDLIVPALSIPATLIVFTGVIAVYQWLIKHVFSTEWVLATLILAASILVIVRVASRGRRDNPLDLFLVAIPIYFQLYFVAALLASGLFRKQPELIVLTAVLIPIGLLLFSWPYWNTIASRIKPAGS